MATYYHNIKSAEADLEQIKASYLFRWGWRRTCNTPGAFWLWVRDFANEDAERHRLWKEGGPGPIGWPSEPRPYGVITADTDLAVLMTVRSLDEQREVAEDE